MTDAESTGNAAFIQAANDAKSLPSKPSDADLLTLYGLFKQGVIGDNTTAKVNLVNLIPAWYARFQRKSKVGSMDQEQGNVND